MRDRSPRDEEKARGEKAKEQFRAKRQLLMRELKYESQKGQTGNRERIKQIKKELAAMLFRTS
jgi:ribosomal protein L29